MPKTHEQDFVDRFISIAESHADVDLCIGKVINSRCKAKKYADVEYVSKSGIHWAIEAKTHESPDFGNAVHKIFGELMKETGRKGRPENVRYALLLPGEGLETFGKSLTGVNKKKFEEFGALIPISSVLYIEGGGIHRITWGQLHGYKKVALRSNNSLQERRP
jgi:hypothetical protein